MSVLFLIAVFPLGAQHVEELYSPFFFSLGPQTAVSEAPASDMFNPASSALEQRIRLNLGYMGIIGSETDPGWGNALTAGVSIPTNAGVVSINGNFISSTLNTVNIGTYGSMHATFSKDLFPNLLVGIGINGAIGDQAGTFDWGLGGDIGFIHNAGTLLGLQDFSWGIAMRTMGKAYLPAVNAGNFPQAFTPALGLSFKAYKSDPISIGFMADISAPGVQNMLLFTALEIDILHTALVRASFQTDYRSLFDTPTDRFPFAFGFSLKFQLDLEGNGGFLQEQGWSKSDFKTNLAFAPFSDGVMAGGAEINIALGMKDDKPPKVKVNPVTPEASSRIPDDDPDKSTLYVSPNLDGIQDNLELPVSIEDERFVKGYKLVISDEKSNIVRTIGNKEERPENLELDNVVNRILYVKSGVAIPEKLVWDGKNEAGEIVGDGLFAWHIEAWDDNGNTIETPKKKVIVDKTAPQTEPKASYLVFSPNGDGNKDSLPIKLSGSKEDHWAGVVTDARGTVVKTYEWKNAAPADLAWDGTNEEGMLVPDGVYSFAVSSTDRAGNKTGQKVDNIIINTVATPINMTVDTAYFSPNNDRIKDVVNFSLSIGVTSGIEKWSLVLSDKSGKKVRTFSGADTIATSFVFDGKNDTGTLLDEGTYNAKLDVLYINGNNPKIEAPNIILDLTPPSVKLTADNDVFSPNNDGKKDFVTVSAAASEEDIWSGTIINTKSGDAVKTYLWKGKPESKIIWGGKGDEGSLLEDGEYSMTVTSTDRAGNTFVTPALKLSINTEETPVLFSASQEAFSPNGDRVKDTITFAPQLKVTDGIDSYTMTIKTEAGKTVKTYTGKKTAPANTIWNGKQDNGTAAPDGAYTAELNLLYINGNNPVAKTTGFIIDTVAPTVAASSEYTLFSPDDDTLKDTIAIAQKTSNETLWEARIVNKAGKIVKSFFWKGQAQNITWDGKDDNGNRLPNGTYVYTISSTDLAGNSAEDTVAGIEIDTTPTPIFITLEQEAFSPNNDKEKDNIDFGLFIGNKNGISTWSIELRHKTAGVQKTFTGTTPPGDTITWEGKTDKSQPAPEGIYTAVMTVQYTKGNKPFETSTPFSLDISGPDVDLGMSPLPFSPDNDGVEDELAIQTKVTDLTGVLSWRMDIRDPTGVLFTSFSGNGIPSNNIVWDGMSGKKELVQAASDYAYTLTLTDLVGNTTVIDKIIPIDVLVIREGDKLYVRIPSITFAPNTADFTNVEKGAYDKNLWTIERLAQIFKKYSTYQIQIEGHAVSVYWYDKARSEKEQKEELLPLSTKRAEAIKQALVKQGIEAGRISTVGVGASRPIIPFSDEENRWKNRRVEFILIKK